MTDDNKSAGTGEQPNTLCVVCGRVLDWWAENAEPEAAGEWRHSLASRDPAELDHLPVPVPVEEAPAQLRGRCDFCYQDDPEWVVPARSFQMLPESGFVTDWAACGVCVVYVQRGEWNALLRRAVASWQEQHGEPMVVDAQVMLRRMYRQLRKNITGAPRRMGP